MNRLRLLILILGPVPIVGSSWALSAWFRSDPPPAVSPNHVLHGAPFEHAVQDQPPPIEALSDPPMEADCHRIAVRVRGALGAECAVMELPPLIVAGDYSDAELAEIHERTILPAMQAMADSYFSTPPSAPITVLLFREEASYNRYCEQLFNERGISIYGYYKPKMRTLVLNLATGHGTLLHELTHALLAFDFPEAPDWFNEGLASLHEQSRFRTDGGRAWIEGLVNWRLAGLQQVALAGQLPAITEMMENPRFRGPSEGTNYAQARYFCLYLQQRGLLELYYRSFRDQVANDPTGVKTLARISDLSIDQLDREFRQWVVALESAEGEDQSP